MKDLHVFVFRLLSGAKCPQGQGRHTNCGDRGPHELTLQADTLRSLVKQ